MIARRFLTTLLAASLLLPSGCGAMIFRSPESILVTTNVTTALVSANGEGQACKGSGRLDLDRSKDHIITVSAEGYEPKIVRVDTHFSWWRAAVSVILNGTHGFFTLFISTVIGIGIDAGTGAWQYLAPEDFEVQLERSPPAPNRVDPAPQTPAPDVSAREIPVAPVKTVREIPTGTGASSFCTSCGAPLEEGTSFCAGCGAAAGASPAPKQPREVNCAFCGEPRLVGAAVCPHCGQK